MGGGKTLGEGGTLPDFSEISGKIGIIYVKLVDSLGEATSNFGNQLENACNQCITHSLSLVLLVAKVSETSIVVFVPI